MSEIFKLFSLFHKLLKNLFIYKRERGLQLKETEIEEMEKLFDKLFPICRSITGPGLRKTLDILNGYIPLERFGVKTGTEVLNWSIPQEWRINEAWIKGPDGNKIIDFKESNLHVVNYSIPVDKKINLEELKNHLYTLSNKPDAIPYVTSYYKRRWGFCLKYNTYKELEHGEYHVYIDSELVNGELNYGHAILPGESEKEILISTYICHPSLANNELSGPMVTAFLYKRLANWSKRRFTYRFVFAPETIGSITYLDKYGEHLKEKLHSGLVLTCLGGKEDLSYKLSRSENEPIDEIIKNLFKKDIISGEIRPFTPTGGSDERQYCSPGFNLPMGQMARTVYGNYPGYHNSLDTKESMTIESLHNSVNEIELILKALELNGYYINKYPYGEIKLDQYNLYPNVNSPEEDDPVEKNTIINREQLNQMLTILNYSDGQHSLLQIANKCDYNLLKLKNAINILKDKGLLEGPFYSKEVEQI